MAQWTLGRLIRHLAELDPTARIRFDFCDFVPTTWDSYRGYYDQLALGFSEDAAAPTIADFLSACRECVGKTFQGWKGGDYVMDEATQLWVANPGRCHGTAIVGLGCNGPGYDATIETERLS